MSSCSSRIAFAMRPFAYLTALLAWCVCAVDNQDLGDAVTWDPYSLMVNGSR